jgi:hypothetical protein
MIEVVMQQRCFEGAVGVGELASLPKGDRLVPTHADDAVAWTGRERLACEYPGPAADPAPLRGQGRHVREGGQPTALLAGRVEIVHAASIVGPENPERPWDPNRGREVLEDLLMEAELEAELERIGRLTPEQLEEELEEQAKSSGVSRQEARERASQRVVRAIEKADAEASQSAPSPQRSLADQLDEAWVRRIGTMTLAEIKELAVGGSLSDKQAEAILRRAKARIEESSRSSTL